MIGNLITKKLFKLTGEEKRNMQGYLFIFPWIIGVIIFFAIPFISAFTYIFSSVKLDAGKLQQTFVGSANINKVFLQDPQSIRLIVESVGNTFSEVILISVFSIFMAVMLNREFRGRTAARALFALPIIVSSGVLLAIFKEDLFAQSMVSNASSTIFNSSQLQNLLMQSGFSLNMVNTVTGLVNQILDLVWKSGVQILLFLAGLQTIPKPLYEVCGIEGSTTWQTFWKVTFPMVSPFLLLNVVYTIIDSFTFFGNPVMSKVSELFNNMHYELSTTLSIAYFLFVLVATGIVAGLISKRVFYIEN